MGAAARTGEGDDSLSGGGLENWETEMLYLKKCDKKLEPTLKRCGTVLTSRVILCYSRSDRADAENRMEIDFLLAKSQTEKRHNIIPIEVKSAKSYTFKSLKKFIGKHADFVSAPHVLHTKDVLVDADGVVRLPLYMVPLLIQ